MSYVYNWKQELSSYGHGRPFGHNRHGPKSGGWCAPFRGTGAGPYLRQCGWVEAYLRTKWYPDPSNRLATIHQRYRQTGRQRSHSTQRTVLQTVAQNSVALSVSLCHQNVLTAKS